MYLIDTNIFLELFLDRERREECKKFLSKIENGEIIGVITSFSLHSIAIILEKLKGLSKFIMMTCDKANLHANPQKNA